MATTVATTLPATTSNATCVSGSKMPPSHCKRRGAGQQRGAPREAASKQGSASPGGTGTVLADPHVRGRPSIGVCQRPPHIHLSIMCLPKVSGQQHVIFLSHSS